MMFSRCILLVAGFVAVANAVLVNDTDVDGDLYLDAVEHQRWVQDFGRKGCQYANQVRAQYGHRQLYYSGSLTNLGARHSNWMAYHNILRHQSLNGLGAWVGPHWLRVTAENIAMSNPRSRDPSWDAHQQWYHSPGHFRNMISSRHTHCGVGIAYDRSGRWWGTQLFGYSSRFGNEGTYSAAPAPASAPSRPGRIPGRASAPAPAARASPSPRSRPSSSNRPGSAPLADSGIQQSMLGEPLAIDGIDPSTADINPPTL